MNSIYRKSLSFLFLLGCISFGTVRVLAQGSSQVDTVEIRYHGITDKAIRPLFVVANSATNKNQSVDAFPEFKRYIFVDLEVLDLFSKHIGNYFDTTSCKAPGDTVGYPDGAFAVTRHIHNGSKKENILSDTRCSRRFFSNMVFEMMKVQDAELLVQQLEVFEQRVRY